MTILLWFDGSRAAKAITNVISHKIEAKYVIPTKINMEDGLKNKLINKNKGEFKWKKRKIHESSTKKKHKKLMKRRSSNRCCDSERRQNNSKSTYNLKEIKKKIQLNMQK